MGQEDDGTIKGGLKSAGFHWSHLITVPVGFFTLGPIGAAMGLAASEAIKGHERNIENEGRIKGEEEARKKTEEETHQLGR